MLINVLLLSNTTHSQLHACENIKLFEVLVNHVLMSVEEHDGGDTHVIHWGIYDNTIIYCSDTSRGIQGKCCEPLHNIRLLFAAYVYIDIWV